MAHDALRSSVSFCPLPRSPSCCLSQCRIGADIRDFSARTLGAGFAFPGNCACQTFTVCSPEVRPTFAQRCPPAAQWRCR